MGVQKAKTSIVRKNSAGLDFERRRINLIEGTNVTLTVADDSANNEVDITIDATAGAGGYSIAQEEGVALTSRTKLNFVGAGFTAADDAANTRTNVTLATTLNTLSSNTAPAGTLVGTTDTQTLTNKSLSDSTTFITDDADATKKVQFQVSGVSAGTTRTKTFQDVSGTVYETGGTDVAVADGGTGVSTVPTNGQLLIGNGTGYTAATLTAGSNVTITNAAGSITIASTGGASATFVGARVNKTANQVVSTATDTAVTWNAEDYDTNTIHDNVTNNTRLTVPASNSGKYFVTGQIRFQNSATGVRLAKIRINGTTVKTTNRDGSPNGTNNSTINVSDVIDLTAGDYVELIAHQTSGGNLDVITTTGDEQYFLMYKIA